MTDLTMTAPRCPVCRGALRPWFEKMGRRVYKCPSCAHIAVPEGVVRRSDGLTIYESDDSIFESDGNQDYYFDQTNAAAASAKADYVARVCPLGGRLLDVGASYGHFLAAASPRFLVTGIEVSQSAAEWARSTFGVSIQVGSVYDLPADLVGTCDAVTFWDVIEHLEDPAGAVRELRQCLRPNGMLFLSTPDAGSLVAKVMGRRWHYLDPVQHINLFSRRNLIRLLTEQGFSVVETRYFGRGYRVSYIINRLSYLTLGRAISLPNRLANWLGAWTIPIKLWDVVGITARRVEPGDGDSVTDAP